MDLNHAQQAGTIAINGWVIGSVFVSAVVIVYAIARQRNAPQPVGIDDLLRRVNELERLDKEKTTKISEQDSVIRSLQHLLVEKDQENQALTAKMNQMEAKLRNIESAVPHVEPVSAKEIEKNSGLILACIGKEEMFRVDLAALRTVRTKTGLRFSRVYPVTMANLKLRLDSYRINGTPIRYIHFAVHGSEVGLLFSDGLATGLWLSQQLSGTEIAVIASCKSDQVGDLLGVVSSVITMAEDIENSDAGKFTEAFWTGIGEGLAVDDAYERALDRCPPEVAEFVVLH